MSENRRPVTLVEFEDLLELAILPLHDFASRLSKLSPAEVYLKFRRALAIRLALREERPLPLEFEGGLGNVAFGSGAKLLKLYKSIRLFLLETANARDRVSYVKELGLFPKDELVTTELSISGSGIFKAAEFKEVDQLIDGLLGVRTRELAAVTRSISRGFGAEKPLLDLPSFLLHTSYLDIHAAVDSVSAAPGTTFVDLGAGLGRVGFFIGLTRPDCQFIGHELVQERVTEAEMTRLRFGMENVSFRETDLGQPHALRDGGDVFFCYDSFSLGTRERVFSGLREQSVSRPIMIMAIEGNGDFIPWVAAQPWLRETVSKGSRWKTRVFTSTPGARQ